MSIEKITSTGTVLIVRFGILPGLKEQARINDQIRAFFQQNWDLQEFRSAITFGIKEMHVQVVKKRGGEIPNGRRIKIDFGPLLNSVGLQEAKPKTATIKRKPLTR